MPATQYTDSLEPYLPGCAPVNPNLNTLDTFKVTYNNGQTTTVTRQCLVNNYLENATGHFLTSYRITEPSLFDAVIREAEELTDLNLVCECYIELCKLIVDTNDLTQEFYYMLELQQQMGYMPNDAITKRRGLYETMLATAKIQLTDEQYTRFYGAT